MIFKSLLFLCLSFTSGALDLISLRRQLDQAANSRAQAENFNNQFRNISEKSSAILIGYKAISEMMLCKHLSNPISKLSHFRKGRRLLEIAIIAAPTNPELRFFRFTTQSNIPSLLNYSSDLDVDKALLINYLRTSGTNTDPDLFNRIKNYLLSSKFCSAKEIKLIKSL